MKSIFSFINFLFKKKAKSQIIQWGFNNYGKRKTQSNKNDRIKLDK